MIMTEELKALLQVKPRRGERMTGRQALTRANYTHTQTLDTFANIFSRATNDAKPRVINADDDSLKPAYGYATRASGFTAHILTGRLTDEEAEKAAHKAAAAYEAEACEQLCVLLQSEGFTQGLRVAYCEAHLTLAKRGFDDSDLWSVMAQSVWKPEEKGAGLPEVLRRIVAHGALAVAVFLAVVQGDTVGAYWNRLLRIADDIDAQKAGSSNEI